MGHRRRVLVIGASSDIGAALERRPDRLSAVVDTAGLFDRAPADIGDPDVWDVWDEVLLVYLAAAMG